MSPLCAGTRDSRLLTATPERPTEIKGCSRCRKLNAFWAEFSSNLFGMLSRGRLRAKERANEKELSCGFIAQKPFCLGNLISASSLWVSDWGWNEPTIHPRSALCLWNFCWIFHGAQKNFPCCCPQNSQTESSEQGERVGESIAPRESPPALPCEQAEKINFSPSLPSPFGAREKSFHRQSGCCCFSPACSPLPIWKHDARERIFSIFLLTTFCLARYEKTVWWESSTGHDGIPLLWFVDSNLDSVLLHTTSSDRFRSSVKKYAKVCKTSKNFETNCGAEWHSSGSVRRAKTFLHSLSSRACPGPEIINKFWSEHKFLRNPRASQSELN